MYSGIKIITIDIPKPVRCVGVGKACVRIFFVENGLNIISSCRKMGNNKEM